MASYKADIEIGVRGVRNLEQLRSSINQTAQAVTSLNEVVGARGSLVQSIQNYVNNLNTAARSLELVGAGTVAETKAVREYVRALGEANTARARQNSLVAQELANQRRVSPGNAGFGQQGPALPPAIVQAQKVRQRWNQFFNDAENVANDLQTAAKARTLNTRTKWAAFFDDAAKVAEDLKTATQQKAADARASWITFFNQAEGVAADLAQQVQRLRAQEGAASEAARQRLSEQAATRQRIRDAGFGIQGPALPPEPAAARAAAAVNSNVAAQKRLNNLIASAKILEQKLLQQRVKGLDVSQQLIQVQRIIGDAQQNSVNITKNYLDALDNVLNSLRNELKLRKEIVATHKTTPSTRQAPAGGTVAAPQADKRGREALSNAIIGGAFPLLFGQGLGASIGGGLGGAAGGLLGGQFGFALSLVGTALGQTFDTASQSAADFTKALKSTGDASDVLEAALGSLDRGTKTTIQNLAKSGQEAEAAKASFEALALEIGLEQAKAFKRAGEATTEWGANFQKWLTKTYASVVLLGEAIKNNFPTGPGLQGAGSVFDLVEAQPRQTLSQEAQDRIEDLAGQNALLEKQVNLARLTVDASTDQRLQLERQIALQEYVNDATELERQLKQKLLSDQEYTLRLKAAELRFTQQIYEVENAAQQARQRQAEEARRAAEKAQREAERAAQKQLQTLNNIRSLKVTLAQQALESADVDVASTRTREGDIAALKESLSQLEARLNIEARILDIQLNQQLSAENITTTERTLYEAIYKEQKANLEAQYLIKARTQQLDLARLQTTRQILFAEKDRALEDIKQQRGTQLAKLQNQLAFPLDSESLDAADQQLDQISRRYEALVPLQRQLQDLETERSNIAASASIQELQNIDQSISSTAAKIETETQYLNKIEETERALLRQQQFFAKYGQAIQSISNEIAGLVTISVSELVRGTKTAEQIFSEFLNAVGNALLQTAQQMITTYIAIGVAKIFAGFSGGSNSTSGLFGAGSPDAVAGGGIFTGAGPFAFRANGGPVTGGAPYVVGERGPELFVPGTGGSVVPTNDLRAAMGSAPGSAGGPVLNMSFETTSIAGVEYVSREQLEQAMAATRRQAANDGAKRGMSMTLDRIQQSPQTRNRLGIR